MDLPDSNFDLRLLVEGQFFMSCPLLPLSNFISYCGDRGVQVTAQHLKRLDRLGILQPVACARPRPIPPTQQELEVDPLAEEWRETLRFPTVNAASWMELGSMSKYVERFERAEGS